MSMCTQGINLGSKQLNILCYFAILSVSLLTGKVKRERLEKERTERCMTAIRK